MRILCLKAFASTLPCLGGCGFLAALSTFSYLFSWFFGGDCCALKGSRVGQILGRWPVTGIHCKLVQMSFGIWLRLALTCNSTTRTRHTWHLTCILRDGGSCFCHDRSLNHGLLVPVARVAAWGRKNVSNGDALCGYVGCNTYGYFHQFLGRLLVVQAAGPFWNLFWVIAGGWPNKMATTMIKKRS